MPLCLTEKVSFEKPETVACLLCHSRMKSLFASRDFRRPHDPVEREVFWCKTCGYGCLGGEIQPAEISSFYDVDYYTHNNAASAGAAASRKPLLDRLRTHLAWRLDFGRDLDPREIDPPKAGQPLTLCDVGCGGGYQLNVFREAGFRVTGVEPDPKARGLAAEVAEVYDGTAEQLPEQVRKRRFGVVLMHHVLEHCVDPIQGLRDVKEILAPGGTLVIEVPNNTALGFSMFQAAWPFADVPRHLHFFSEASLRETLKSVGLQVVKRFYTGYTRQFVPEWISMQKDIWNKLNRGPLPDFTREAWSLLMRTAISDGSRKYDSVRFHATASDLR